MHGVEGRRGGSNYRAIEPRSPHSCSPTQADHLPSDISHNIPLAPAEYLALIRATHQGISFQASWPPIKCFVVAHGSKWHYYIVTPRLRKTGPSNGSKYAGAQYWLQVLPRCRPDKVVGDNPIRLTFLLRLFSFRLRPAI